MPQTDPWTILEQFSTPKPDPWAALEEQERAKGRGQETLKRHGGGLGAIIEAGFRAGPTNVPGAERPERIDIGIKPGVERAGEGFGSAALRGLGTIAQGPARALGLTPLANAPQRAVEPSVAPDPTPTLGERGLQLGVEIAPYLAAGILNPVTAEKFLGSVAVNAAQGAIESGAAGQNPLIGAAGGGLGGGLGHGLSKVLGKYFGKQADELTEALTRQEVEVPPRPTSPFRDASPGEFRDPLEVAEAGRRLRPPEEPRVRPISDADTAKALSESPFERGAREAEGAGQPVGGAGRGNLSLEELSRNEHFYKVTKSGALTFQGKQPDAALKPGEAVVAIDPDGNVRLAAGDQAIGAKVDTSQLRRPQFTETGEALHVEIPEGPRGAPGRSLNEEMEAILNKPSEAPKPSGGTALKPNEAPLTISGHAAVPSTTPIGGGITMPRSEEFFDTLTNAVRGAKTIDDLRAALPAGRQAGHFLEDPLMQGRFATALEARGLSAEAEKLRNMTGVTPETATFAQNLSETLKQSLEEIKKSDEGGYLLIGKCIAEGCASGPELTRAIAKATAQGIRPADRLKAGLYNAWLSSPKTHLRNIESNVLELAAQTIERGAQNPRTAIGMFGAGEGLYKAVGNSWQMMTKALGEAQHGFKTGLTREVERGGVERAAEEVARLKGLPGALTAPSRALAAADNFFQSLSYSMGLGQKAYEHALSKGFKAGSDDFGRAMQDFLSNTPKDTVEELLQESARATFRDQPGAISRGLTSMREGLDNYTGIGGTLLVPFIRTPLTIGKRVVEYSPLGFINGLVRAGIGGDIAGGSEKMIRGAIGSSALAALYALAERGHITGDGQNLSTLQRSSRERAQAPNNSIRLGDSWVSYNNMGPITGLLQLASNMNEYMNSGKADPYNMPPKAIQELTKAAIDATFLPNLFDFVGGVLRGEQFETALGSQLGRQAQPVQAVADVARAVDPMVRSGQPENTAQAAREAFFSRVPGLTQEIPAKLNPFGQEIESSMGPAERLISPHTRREVATDIPSRLFESISGLRAPTDPQTGEPEEPLARDQKRQRDQIVGQLRAAMLERYADRLQDMSVEERQINIERLTRQAGAQGGEIASQVRRGRIEFEEAIRRINGRER